MEVNSRRAMEILDDPNRELLISNYLRLEVLPKPMFHKRLDEVSFMQAVLDNATDVSTSPELTTLAVELASEYDMSPLDALHVSSAVKGSANELITMEKDTKPICKVRQIKVVSLHLKEIEKH